MVRGSLRNGSVDKAALGTAAVAATECYRVEAACVRVPVVPGCREDGTVTSGEARVAIRDAVVALCAGTAR